MKRSFFIFLTLNSLVALAQNGLSVVLNKTDQSCLKGKASVLISGGTTPYKISWNTGDTNVTSIKDLSEGDYSVLVKDAANKDTLINFNIAREDCRVAVPNHFTPNDDAYNDTWSIFGLQYYPDFELFVYDRSGQTVYHQSGTYIPWDGRWLGVKVPDATYYYVIYLEKENKKNLVKGDITIIR